MFGCTQCPVKDTCIDRFNIVTHYCGAYDGSYIKEEEDVIDGSTRVKETDTK